MQKQTIMKYENLGETKPTGKKLAELFYEVAERFENMLPTTFTSRYEGEALVKALSSNADDEAMAQSIVSRLVIMRSEGSYDMTAAEERALRDTRKVKPSHLC